MHSLETLARLNNDAARADLERAYGRAMIENDRTNLGPERRNRLHERIRRLRAALLALIAALSPGCDPDRDKGPVVIVDPGPPFGPSGARPRPAVHHYPDGSVVIVVPGVGP